MGKRLLIIWVLLITICNSSGNACFAMNGHPNEDSRELQYQDMLMLFLSPYIEDQLPDIYGPLLTVTPHLYPYMVEVKKVERVERFRHFDFIVSLEIVPTVGPHIPAGKDRFTFRISYGNVKVINIEHLKDPNKDDFPPNYSDMLRK